MTIARYLAIGLAIALLGVAHNAQTPQAAAKAVFYVPPGRTAPGMGRTNVSGRFAVVQVNRGIIESGSVAGRLILLKRFSYGWQALSLIDNHCDLDLQDIPSHVRDALLTGMPEIKSGPASDCAYMYNYGDAGPAIDVESIRVLAQGGFRPGVVVVGNYGMSAWYGGGGGEALYHKSHGAWKRIGGGGGAMSKLEAEKYGVPQGDVCKFPIYDCPHPGVKT